MDLSLQNEDVRISCESSDQTLGLVPGPKGPKSEVFECWECRSWWQRLFALPFHTNFSQAESRNVTIPRPPGALEAGNCGSLGMVRKCEMCEMCEMCEVW